MNITTEPNAYARNANMSEIATYISRKTRNEYKNTKGRRILKSLLLEKVVNPRKILRKAVNNTTEIPKKKNESEGSIMTI